MRTNKKSWHNDFDDPWEYSYWQVILDGSIRVDGADVKERRNRIIRVTSHPSEALGAMLREQAAEFNDAAQSLKDAAVPYLRGLIHEPFKRGEGISTQIGPEYFAFARRFMLAWLSCRLRAAEPENPLYTVFNAIEKELHEGYQVEGKTEFIARWNDLGDGPRGLGRLTTTEKGLSLSPGSFDDDHDCLASLTPMYASLLLIRAN